MERVKKYRLPELALVIETPLHGVAQLGTLLKMMVRDPIIVADHVEHAVLVWQPPEVQVMAKSSILTVFAISGLATRCTAYRNRRRRTPSAATWTRKGVVRMIKGLPLLSTDTKAVAVAQYLRMALRSARSWRGRLDRLE